MQFEWTSMHLNNKNTIIIYILHNDVDLYKIKNKNTFRVDQYGKSKYDIWTSLKNNFKELTLNWSIYADNKNNNEF